MARITTKIE